MAEVGSAFTMEGGPYEWVKLAFGRFTAGSPRSSTGSRTRSGSAARSRSLRRLLAREHLQDRCTRLRRLRLQARLHLDLDHRRDRLAALRQVDPERRRVHADLRARLLLDHASSSTAIKHGVARLLRLSDLSPTRAVFLGARAGAALQLRRLRAAERRGRGDGRTRRSDVPISVLRSGIIGVLALRRSRSSGSSLVLPAKAITASAGSSTPSRRPSASTAARRTRC